MKSPFTKKIIIGFLFTLISCSCKQSLKGIETGNPDTITPPIQKQTALILPLEGSEKYAVRFEGGSKATFIILADPYTPAQSPALTLSSQTIFASSLPVGVSRTSNIFIQNHNFEMFIRLMDRDFTITGTLEEGFVNNIQISINAHIIQSIVKYRFNHHISDMKILSNGKVLLLGTRDYCPENSTSPSDVVYEMYLMRFLNNGRLDPSFGDRGIITENFGRGDKIIRPKKMIPLSQNAVLVGAEVEIHLSSMELGPATTYLIKYRDNGALDESFGLTGKVTLPNTSYTDMTLVSNEAILLASLSLSANRTQSLTKYTRTGQADPNFRFNGIAYQLATEDDGSFITFFVGYSVDSTASSPSQSLYVNRYLADGSPDGNFADRGQAEISLNFPNDLIMNKVILNRTSTGDYLFGGASSLISSNFRQGYYVQIKVLSTGNLDTSFGTNGISRLLIDSGFNSYDYYQTIDNTGNIYVATTWITDSSGEQSLSYSRLLKYFPAGALDTSFHGSGFWDFELTLPLADGSLYHFSNHTKNIQHSSEDALYIAVESFPEFVILKYN